MVKISLTGKTTLISTITDIITPTSGTISVDGFDNVSQYRQTRSLIGLVSQETLKVYTLVIIPLKQVYIQNVTGNRRKPITTIEEAKENKIKVVANSVGQKKSDVKQKVNMGLMTFIGG